MSSTIEEFLQEKREAEIKIGEIMTNLSRKYLCKVDISADYYQIEQIGNSNRSYVYKSEITAMF